MERTSLTKSTRLPLFSGLQKDFQAWWVRFITDASVGKFLAVLQIGGESTMPSSDIEVINETTDAGKETATAKQRSKCACCYGKPDRGIRNRRSLRDDLQGHEQ
jgi:hypothetical protein